MANERRRFWPRNSLGVPRFIPIITRWLFRRRLRQIGQDMVDGLVAGMNRAQCIAPLVRYEPGFDADGNLVEMSVMLPEVDAD